MDTPAWSSELDAANIPFLFADLVSWHFAIAFRIAGALNHYFGLDVSDPGGKELPNCSSLVGDFVCPARRSYLTVLRDGIGSFDDSDTQLVMASRAWWPCRIQFLGGALGRGSSSRWFADAAHLTSPTVEVVIVRPAGVDAWIGDADPGFDESTPQQAVLHNIPISSSPSTTPPASG